MKPKILITNDDGISAPGIKTLWEALKDYGDITIVAPVIDRSGASLGITMRKPLHIEQASWEQNTSAWKVTGTPADCVKLALAVVLEEKPDLVVSGINRGSNAGRTVLYSGTIGGVIEGCMRRIPGIAFSMEEQPPPDYSLAKPYIVPIVKHVLESPLPHGTILNVNFPSENIQGIKLARQGKSYWMDNPDERIHPEGLTYYWLGGRWDDQEEHEESDVFFLRKGYAAAVPIHVDELTDLSIFQARKNSFEQSLRL